MLAFVLGSEHGRAAAVWVVLGTGMIVTFFWFYGAPGDRAFLWSFLRQTLEADDLPAG
jgi:hypothetical protein